MNALRARIIALAFLPVTLSVASFAPADEVRPNTGTIIGSLFDSDHKPVPNAAVILLGQQRGAASDSGGGYIVRNVPAGIYAMRAGQLRVGRCDKEGIVVSGGDTTHVDFVLTKSEAEPPEYTGHEIECDDWDPGDSERESLVQVGARTEERSRGSLVSYRVVNRGQDTLTEVRIGYDATKGRCELRGTDGHVVPDTALGPPGWICVPVQGREDSTSFALSWRATSAGISPRSSEARFTVILPRHDSIYERCHWLATGDSSRGGGLGRLKRGADVERIAMKYGSITGTVLDQVGRPVGGATVQLIHAGPSVTTEPDGTYRLVDVPVGTYTLNAGMLGFRPCGKGRVRVTADKVARADFRLSTGTTRIPCRYYRTDGEQAKRPFLEGLVDRGRIRPLKRTSPVPATRTGSTPEGFAYSLSDHQIELVYHGLGEDTAQRAFIGTVRREFRTPLEERLLRIAEETYPPAKAVAFVANDRADRKELAKTPRLWWYGHFDGVRLPFAITMDAVRYYFQLVQQMGRGETTAAISIPMKACEFGYVAKVSGPKDYRRKEQSYSDVYVVEMHLKWFNYCSPLCACWFDLDRTVLIRADGHVLCVFGDSKPTVAVS